MTQFHELYETYARDVYRFSLYLSGDPAGEASADTVALMEEFLRLDPDLARTVEALRANPLPALPTALRPTQEKETLI
jgi:hypothetical protein